MNWQLIDTAPKDGTKVLAWYAENGGFPCISYFVDSEEFEYGKQKRKRAEWVGPSWFRMDLKPDPQPTHWMPLPKAPE